MNMEGRLNWVKFGLVVAAAGLLLGSCDAQGMVHVVGDSLGWVVPPGGPIAYTTWAANQTFLVGDILEFNFKNGSHDVVEVSKAEFDSCNLTNSNNTVHMSSPAKYTLDSAGSRYFICTFQGHCLLGQKLAINVTTMTSHSPVPAPGPSIAESPSEAPTRSPVTYIVGDAAGWNVLAGGARPYQLWAANKTFIVGDTLVFNFINGTHNVAEVSKAAFDSCDTNTTTSLLTHSPVSIMLSTPGEHYYTCTLQGLCSLGQKLAINVITTTSPSPVPAPGPSIAETPCEAPTRSPVTYIVGDAVGWNVLAGGARPYQLWAANKTFIVGDTLVFNFINGTHDVAEVSKAAFDSCDTNTTTSLLTHSPVSIVLSTPGEHYFTCTFQGHCSLGQKLAINVIATTSPSPVPAPGPSIAKTPSEAPTRSPVTYIVGDAAGWNVLAGGARPYQLWAANKTFIVGDTLVFNFINGTHDVAEVSKAAFDSCDTNTTISLLTQSPVSIVLSTPGEHYYTCTFQGHCSLGQQLAINVIGTSSSATPPSSSPGAATPPSSSTTSPPPPSASTPTGTPRPPPPATTTPASSASSLGVTGFAAAVLSVTVALLY